MTQIAFLKPFKKEGIVITRRTFEPADGKYVATTRLTVVVAGWVELCWTGEYCRVNVRGMNGDPICINVTTDTKEITSFLEEVIGRN